MNQQLNATLESLTKMSRKIILSAQIFGGKVIEFCSTDLDPFRL